MKTVEQAVRETLDAAHHRSFEILHGQVQASEIAYFPGGEAYLRVGPGFYGAGKAEMAVVISRVSLVEKFMRQGIFNRLTKEAGRFAAEKGFALVHENVLADFLAEKHRREGLHELPGSANVSSFILTADKVKARYET